MPETPAIPISSIEEEILFPAKVYTLTGGRLVTIKPWGMAVGRSLGPRVGELIQRLHGDYSPKALARLIRTATDEVYEISRLTLGWTTEQMDELAFEDLFVLAQGIIEVCLLRGQDAGGLLGKILALAATKRRADKLSASTQPPPRVDEVENSPEP